MPKAVLTSSEAARLLGVSRQHVADLADRGAIRCWRVGTHRRFHRVDVLALLSRLQDASREVVRVDSMNLTDRRSLAYGLLIAAKLVSRPNEVLGVARRNLDHLRKVHSDGSADRYLNRWEELVDSPLETLIQVLVSTDEESIDLRHASPFAGLVTQAELDEIIRATRATA
jgi:excisionase family DNA binding protein